MWTYFVTNQRPISGVYESNNAHVFVKKEKKRNLRFFHSHTSSLVVFISVARLKIDISPFFAKKLGKKDTYVGLMGLPIISDTTLKKVTRLIILT